VETAAFSLEAGATSEVIQSRLGFHVVQTLERATRPLQPDALERLQETAVENWLEARRQDSTVELLIAL
jgi:parvulin-like peptidyl-prolyl isomerase